MDDIGSAAAAYFSYVCGSFTALFWTAGDCWVASAGYTPFQVVRIDFKHGASVRMWGHELRVQVITILALQAVDACLTPAWTNAVRLFFF